MLFSIVSARFASFSDILIMFVTLFPFLRPSLQALFLSSPHSLSRALISRLQVLPWKPVRHIEPVDRGRSSKPGRNYRGRHHRHREVPGDPRSGLERARSESNRSLRHTRSLQRQLPRTYRPKRPHRRRRHEHCGTQGGLVGRLTHTQDRTVVGCADSCLRRHPTPDGTESSRFARL